MTMMKMVMMMIIVTMMIRTARTIMIGIQIGNFQKRVKWQRKLNGCCQRWSSWPPRAALEERRHAQSEEGRLPVSGRVIQWFCFCTITGTEAEEVRTNDIRRHKTSEEMSGVDDGWRIYMDFRNGCMVGLRDGNRWIDGRTDWWKDRWMSGWVDALLPTLYKGYFSLGPEVHSHLTRNLKNHRCVYTRIQTLLVLSILSYVLRRLYLIYKNMYTGTLIHTYVYVYAYIWS